MPDFKFRSQVPLPQIAQLYQQKPVLEQEAQLRDEENKRARLSSLLTNLSSAAQLARTGQEYVQNKMQIDAANRQREGQSNLLDVLSEPTQSAPVAAPVQQFVPSPIPNANAGQLVPKPMPVTPTFGQTNQGATQDARLTSALFQSDPTNFTKFALERKFGVGSNAGRPHSQAYTDSNGQVRIGTYDPTQQRVIQRPEDPLAGYANGMGVDPYTGLPYVVNRAGGFTSALGLPSGNVPGLAPQNQPVPPANPSGVNTPSVPTLSPVPGAVTPRPPAAKVIIPPMGSSVGNPTIPAKATSYADLLPKQRELVDNMSKEVQGDEIVKGIQDRQSNINNLRTLINSNNPASIGPLQSQMARAVAGERGVLTDQDVLRNTGSRALADRFMRFVKTHYNGQLTDTDRTEFGQLLDIIEEKSNQNLDRRYGIYVDKLKARIPNADPQALRTLISQGSMAAGSDNSVPAVGGSFNGEKVMKVERVQ